MKEQRRNQNILWMIIFIRDEINKMDNFRLLALGEEVEENDEYYMHSEFEMPCLYINENTKELTNYGTWVKIPDHYIGKRFGFNISLFTIFYEKIYKLIF